MATDRREAIIGEALHFAARFGIQKTNANQIAKQMGIRPSNVFYYFPQQKDLYIAMVQAIIVTNNDLVANIQETHPDASTAERIRLYLDGNIDWAKRFPEQVSALLYGILETSHDEFMRDLVQRALGAGEDKIYHYLVTGIAEKEFATLEPPRQAARYLHQILIGCIVSLFVFRHDDYQSRLANALEHLLEAP